MNIDLSALEQAFAKSDEQPTSETVDTREPETQPESRADEVVQAEEAPADSVQEDSQPSPETSKHIPYSRFKSVIEERNSLRAQIEELKKSSSQPRQEEEDLSFLTMDDDQAPEDSRLAALEKRLNAYEMEKAQAQLKAEVDAITRDYPEVPAQVLFKAIAEDPSLDLETVAVNYSSFLEEIRSKAIEDYKQKTKATPPPHVPRGGDGKFSSASKPRTLDDAHQELFKALMKGG